MATCPTTLPPRQLRPRPKGTLRPVTLGHLSRDCNTPQIARETIAAKLDEAGIDTIQINVSTQADPTETLML
ncbi:MAG: hypothetical protein CM1200mP29_15500 [Verrucomicrobiota bacterium]|nr:MAG: hypothetical protein CM1200mP29_15500 [Verrucomicrobiota bacterium]